VQTSPGTTYSARGFRAHDFHDAAVERHVSQQRSLALSIAHYRTSYQRFPDLIPAAEQRFEQTVSLINSWGVTPVVVLTPVHPLFAQQLAAPWGRMHRKVLAYLRSLPPTLRIHFIDASSIATFGGTPRAFYDGVHMKVANMRLLLRYVIQASRRDLSPVP
jgi:lysophospholipase L1-like esterase